MNKFPKKQLVLEIPLSFTEKKTYEYGHRSTRKAVEEYRKLFKSFKDVQMEKQGQNTERTV